ncbi:centromere protein F-like [Zootoca vivipara]|uniref:centromere protein F-like n=1 Tax=Zootoca vivipara TaxID=8524 RepID=UPI00293BAFB5|nr:centromere protein F-like [Zootoca vivipara]
MGLQIQDSSPAVRGPCGKESPAASWQQEAACPSAPPGSPIPTENGEGAQAMASELASMGERLEKENQELRLALGKAETRMQEKERELWNLQGQLELIRAELAQWKKQRGGQTEGLLGTEKVPSSGSRRSISSSRLEQPAEKRGAHTKLKGFPSPSSRAQSTERGREELQALRTEVLMLRRRLDASESQRKTLLEACWQQEKSRAWAQKRQLGPLVGAAGWQKTKDSPEIHGDCQAPRSKGQALAGGGEVSVAEEVEEERGALEPEAVAEPGKALALDVETSETGEDAPAPAPRQAHGKTEAGGQGGRTPDLEGNVEGLQENLLDLASGKAQAEAQAILAQEKLQVLQATLGRQTERLARAMETQSRHVEELLADAEEKEQLMRSLRQELEETKKALEMADDEGQRLRALLGQREAEGHHHAESPSNTSEVRGGSEASEVPLVSAQLQGGMLSTADVGLAGRLPEEKQVQPGVQEQLEASLAQLQQENLVLRKELATWEAWHQKRGEEDTTGPFELVGSGNGREAAEMADVPEASQKREPLSQGSRRNVQTQTEGLEFGHRRRERVSVAFDDTQYEPYGLPEVVMKGFADIPSGPSCPYVLRRGILGSAPVAQLAPRAEPEEDSPEAEEGTGV